MKGRNTKQSNQSLLEMINYRFVNVRELMEQTAKRTLIACILVSLAGIAFITALDYEDNTRTMDITKIDNKLAGETIIVCGDVKSKSVSSSGITFITLAEKNSKAQTIPLVFFKNEVHETENISRGRSLCARGTIQIYNRSVEIIGRKIV